MMLWKTAVVASLALAATACDASTPPAHLRIEGGDAATGRQLIRQYGCGACHLIEGVPGAQGAVGPALSNFAQRTVLAGAYPNVPRILVPWLLNPQALRPGTAMPRLGLSVAEARHIASYLYTRGAENAVVFQVRPTAEHYPWLSQAEAHRTADRQRLAETERIGPQHARIPIERAMELLVTAAAGADAARQ